MDLYNYNNYFLCCQLYSRLSVGNVKMDVKPTTCLSILITQSNFRNVAALVMLCSFCSSSQSFVIVAAVIVLRLGDCSSCLS